MPLQKLYEIDSKLSPAIVILTLLLFSGFFALGIYFHIELYVFLGVTALPLMWAMVNYPRVWIYFIVIMFIVFFRGGETELNATHILAALFYDLFLIVWFINKLLIRREKITRGIHDQIILFFYGVLLFHSIVSISHGVELIDWLREYFSISLILYYFPIREYFTEKKHILHLLFLIGFVTIILDFYAFYNYYNILKDITYAYQFASTIRINQQLYVAVALGGIAFFFYFKKWRYKLFSALVAGFTIAALVSTLSRAFWVSLFGIIFIFILYLRIKQVVQLLTFVLVATSIFVVTLNTYMPDKANMFYKYLSKRLISTGKGKKDISIRARLYEYREVVKGIEKSPVWGNGLRHEFMFYSNLSQTSARTSFVHNGYLGIAYKTGIPLAIAFYLPILLYLIQGFLVSIRTSSYLHKTLAICGMLSLLMLFATNFVTSSFLFKDGLMVTALAIAFISIATENYEKEKYSTLINKKNYE
ncbi:MAG: O-antigen ligase family protein [Ignavibacteria bacterium]|jgi:O-antigen ligase|nr:O-antigen ligase family protein [Ignavibacteria bacterium]